jgi:hypothetical protein
MHADIAEILSNRFFVDTPATVPTWLEEDPSPRATRELPRIPEGSIGELIADTSNLSSPGASGQTWQLIKWAWMCALEVLTDLITGCVWAGHHLLIWRLAIVCAVPKPHRADYSLVKNFHLVSLLECMGKIVEKLVARLIYGEIITHDLIPTNQYGGRMSLSTLDAGLTLTYDIQGYFNNINRERLVQVVTDLGFAQEIVSWTKTFLSERTVRLKFNSHTSEVFNSEVGTPQGSPISPVLSTLYMHALLWVTRDLKWTSLNLYIDDGAILACGKEWAEVESSLTAAYTTCTSWIGRSGLKAEPDKTELMYFRQR